MTSCSRLIRRSTAALALLAAAHGCGGKSASGNSNTNWLRSCNSNADCGGGLTCLCNVCTLACTTTSDCTTLGQTAVCDLSTSDQVCSGSTAPETGLCVRTPMVLSPDASDTLTIDSSVGADNHAATNNNPSCAGLTSSCGADGNGDCCESPIVSGGTFNRSNDALYPATISDFRLDKYEVTVGRFRNFVAAYSQDMIPAGAGKNHNNPDDAGWNVAWNTNLPADAAALAEDVRCGNNYQTWRDASGENDTYPLNCVTWYEAYAFCIWDGGRLPTEAEWNYAAAGGDEQRLFPWGNPPAGTDAGLAPDSTYAIYGCLYNATGECTGIANIATVGSAPAGNGRWGQSDLSGNMAEWTLDRYVDPYAQTECIDCADLAAGFRAVRGGSYRIYSSGLLTTYHADGDPAGMGDALGFRCARAP